MQMKGGPKNQHIIYKLHMIMNPILQEMQVQRSSLTHLRSHICYAADLEFRCRLHSNTDCLTIMLYCLPYKVGGKQE